VTFWPGGRQERWLGTQANHPGLAEAPVAAVRAALASALASLPAEDLARLAASARLGMSLPMGSEFVGTVEALAGAVARRAGGGCDDFAARVLAGAVIGVIMAAALPGADGARHRPGCPV
jgi:hypothetical protein